MKSIALCMIVKNESHVILRCLESVKRIINYVLIVDTGSTDGTQESIQKWLSDNSINGQVIDEPWQNFAYNRSFALKKLRELDFIDYGFMIDADEVIIYEEGFDEIDFKNSLWADVYDITTNMNGFIYNRPTLTSNKIDFRYEGVVHEFLAMDIEATRSTATGFYNYPIQDSDRNKSGDKFLKDALALEEALKTETRNFFISRYTFYAAQCYRDAGNLQKAMELYEKRVSQGEWSEEIYVSLYSIANIKRDLNYDPQEVLQSFMRAYEVNPNRAEALHGALVICRKNGWNHQGYMIGKIAIEMCIPSYALFIDKWIYDYAVLDEFSILAYWSGHYQESKEVCERLLSENKIPSHYIERVSSNLNYCLQHF